MNRYLALPLIIGGCLLLLAFSGGSKPAPDVSSSIPAHFFDVRNDAKASLGVVSLELDCTKTYTLSTCCDTQKYVIAEILMAEADSKIVLKNLTLEPLSKDPAARKVQLERQSKAQQDLTTKITKQKKASPVK